MFEGKIHMQTQNICKTPQCGRWVSHRDLCKVCAKEFPAYPKNQTCAAPKCQTLIYKGQKKSVDRNYCKEHIETFKRKKTIAEKAECHYKGCSKLAKVKGLCKTHYHYQYTRDKQPNDLPMPRPKLAKIVEVARIKQRRKARLLSKGLNIPQWGTI